MRVEGVTLAFETAGAGFTDITADVAAWLNDSQLCEGVLTLFCRHTSASLLISENADPAVRRDLSRWLARAAPEGSLYEHDCEGPDDMPAHIKAMLTGTALTIPFSGGRMTLGTWQAVYLVEHRERNHRREIAVTAMGT